MNKIKPQLPSGMRDFLPADMLRRQYVIDTVAEVFETFGYEPLQTPVMELNETLMGKYGEDAEKLIYNAKHSAGSEELSLRYDLTVPLARAFAYHENELTIPFKRYQIAPVWRGERKARGRFREFYQCDVDTVGIAGMEADAEVINIAVTAIQRLGFDKFAVKINTRKLLTGIGQYAGLTGDSLSDLYRSIDKLDKIGANGVKDELVKRGIEESVVNKIMKLIVDARPENPYGYEVGAEMIATLRQTLEGIPAALDGLRELEQVLSYLKALAVPGEHLDLDFAMVRGLSYYTGPIFEAVLLTDIPEERVGSVAGGGRYDDLIGLFRKDSIPTVGVSLGIERLMTIMGEHNMYPAHLNQTVVQVLVSVFNAETRIESMAVASMLRTAGIKTELMMQDVKLGKQFGYADKKGIPLVAIIGPDEMARGEVKFKRLADQQEATVRRDEIVTVAQNLLKGS